MVMQITSLTRSGLSDYLIQRVTAIILLLYSLCVAGFFLLHTPLDYFVLKGFFSSFPMQCFSEVALFSVAMHGWIGLWTVCTDYIRPHYFGSYDTLARSVAQVICILIIMLYIIWGSSIIWGS